MKIKKVKNWVVLCCSLFVVNLLSAQEEVIFSRLDDVRKLDDFAASISTVSNTQKRILTDNFDIEHKSKITRFNFVGQIGLIAPGDMSQIKGVHVFIFKNIFEEVDGKHEEIPFSGTSLAHFYLDNANAGLLKKVEREKVLISVDLDLAGKELILESGSYWIAFAPVMATDGLPADSVWYWYEGDGASYYVRKWNNGDTEWSPIRSGSPRSMAFSIEGKEVVLGISELDMQTTVITVYPNPSCNIFKINTPKEIVSVAVYNGNGQLVLQNRLETVDLSASPKGVYLLTVSCNDGTQVFEKLIKV
ncbi:T9SS type A sorting domain-containing protein [Flavobacterium sp.]|uniref:T9SS type A sorting domain-containing protein n=1 Tax=Flavobacterium sp. TaxID=239 RepID=UPI002628DAD0|nr:T9SS type A sorting domain-containing protein [Flavobacterium sp.]